MCNCKTLFSVFLSPSKQSRVEDFLQRRDTTPQFGVALTDSILNMLIKDMRPLSMVDDQGFRAMVHTFHPGYTLPSRAFFTMMMEKKYEETFQKVKTAITAINSKVALTMDAWSSIATEAYLGITCHFISDNWELTSYSLTTMPLEERHTAGNIAAWIEEAADKFGISTNKIMSIVHDNAANVVAAVKLLEDRHEISSVRCAGHTLQLVVNHALKNPQISKAVSAARCLVEHFKSELSCNKLKTKQKQMGTPQHKLIPDASTRWNSTYYMTSRLLEQRWPVTATLSDSELTTQGKKYLDLESEQWSLLEELEQALRPFECASTYLSGEPYVTVSALPPLVKGLLRSTQNTAFDTTPVQAFQAAAAQEMATRWKMDISFTGDAANTSVIAAALDPRFRKLKFLSPKEGLEVQLKVQELALQRKRSETDQVDQQHANLAQNAATDISEKNVSLLDSLLGSDSDTSNSEEDNGDGEDSISQMVRNEMLMYFGEQSLGKTESPLKWWKANEARFPTLAMVAKSFLCVPVTSIPSERLFSAAGNIVTKTRASLSAEHVDMLTFLHYNTVLL